jgi:hypothetical protein
MGNFTADVWRQLKNITCDEIISALKRDGWQKDVGGKTSGSIQVYIKGESPNRRRVTIHYHVHSTYRSPKLLDGILESIGWTEADLRRLKLIK